MKGRVKGRVKGVHGRGRLRRYEFDIQPVKGSPLRVRVILWDRLDAMRRFGRALGLGARRARRAAAFCHTPATDGPAVALVNLCREHIGSGLVAHEMLHAAVSYGTRRRWRWRELDSRARVIPHDNAEERLAEMVGMLVKGFWRHVYDHGVIQASA